jgi:hypothetical protein
MSSWGKFDNAANAPYWAVNSTIMNNVQTEANVAAPTAANVALLYGNTSANVYTQGATIGLFGVDAQEALATHAPHAGWVLRTTGSGGRAGRVTHEVLVALNTINGPDGDGQQYPNVTITLVTSGDTSVVSNASFANVATFTVTPTLVGNTAATLTYQWQYNNSTGSYGWANIPANTANIQFAGATTSTLYVKPATTANTTNRYRVIVTAADQGVTATSQNNTITIT